MLPDRNRVIAVNTITQKIDSLLRDAQRLRERASYKPSRAEGGEMAAKAFELAAATLIDYLKEMGVQVTVRAVDYGATPPPARTQPPLPPAMR